MLLGTALVRSLGVKNQADFLVAGRKLTWPVTHAPLVVDRRGQLFAGGENAAVTDSRRYGSRQADG